LYRIIQAIAYCEDNKYPNGKGRKMFAEFLLDAVFTEQWDELAKRFEIPIRCGTYIIDKNKGKE
jgi:hypothetical protein